MSDAAEILVIIISLFLAIFLLVSIVLVVMLIRVTKQIKAITSTTQSAVENLSSTAANISKVTSPVLLGKIILSQFKKFRK